MTKSEKLKHCAGCYNNGYNNGLGGANECWMLESSEPVIKKEVHVDQIPPWKQKAQKFLSCYCRPRYVYVDKNQEY